MFILLPIPQLAKKCLLLIIDYTVLQDDMSIETRNVCKRVSMLSQDISVLSKNLPSSENTNKKNLTLPSDCRRAITDSSPRNKLYNTLPLVLPFGRTHSQPPLVQINDVWEDQEMDSETSDGSDARVSQESQEDYEVKVIHSSRLDSHHQLIVVTSPYDELQHDDEEETSDQLEQEDGEFDNEEDVFDNSLLASQT